MNRPKRLGISMWILSLTLTAGIAVGDPELVSYFSNSRETLNLRTVDGGEFFQLGDLHLDFQSLEFDAQGRLWAITDAALYRLDRQSALPKKIGYFGGSQSFESHLAISDDGEMWISQVFLSGDSTQLLRGDLDTGQAALVSQFDVYISGLAFQGDRLLAIVEGALFEINRDTLTLEPYGLPFGFFPLSHLSVIDDRLFSTIVPVVSPPISIAAELFPETGEVEDLSSLNDVVRGFAIREVRCVPSETTLCFGQDRFEVTVDWQDSEGNGGQGRRLPYTSETSGMFEFFGADNWEVLVKVLSGCEINNRYWVIASASTDVAFSLNVTDLETGEQKVYENPLGRPAGAITDTEAFGECPAP